MTEERNGLPELPQGWVWTDLGEITEPSKEKVNPQEIEIMPYVGLEHIERDTGRLLGFGYSEEVRSTKAVFHSGDLLYGKLRPYLNKVHIADFGGVCSTDILVFPKSSHVSNSYLLYRLLSGDFVRYANLNVSGVQHPRTNFKTLSQFPVALPPFAEQQRIVAKVEELFTQLDAGVAALEKAKTQLRRYRQAVLKAAVEGELTREWREAHRGELEPASVLLERILEEQRARWEAEHPGKRYKSPAPPDMEDLPGLPEGWVWAAIGEAYDVNPRMDWPEGFTEETPVSFVPMAAVDDVSGAIIAAEARSIGDVWRGYKRFAEGDVIFARITPCMENGKAAIAAGLLNGVGLGSTEFHVLRPIDAIMAKWIYHFVRQQSFRKQAARAMTGTAGQLRVPRTFMEESLIPLPPLPEQQRIVAEVEQRLSVAREMEKAVEQSLKRAEHLRQSILKRAFEGKLVPQDPSDEPASVLLERIKAEKARREGEGRGKKRSRKRKQPRQLELL